MEEINISTDQEQELIKLFKKRGYIWVAFFIIGITGILPLGVTFFSDSATNYFSSPSIIFIMLAIVFWSQSDEAIKKIKQSDYRVFKTKCLKTNLFSYASVENNEILSARVKKDIKNIEVLDSPKSIAVNEEIGIIKIGKEFWGFKL